MGVDGGEAWYDQDPGPLVRPFAVTRGRARVDRHELDMITLVLAVRPTSETVRLDRECAKIVHLCQDRPLSVAEIAATLKVLLMVTKVLISDLIDDGFLVRQSSSLLTVDEPDVEVLQAVLDGLCRL